MNGVLTDELIVIYNIALLLSWRTSILYEV